eukprot:TRINITY_DN876_c0_g2_i5.p1 TRINITY_DN876_c0_g2~~TRINITY_DN876_c0_g2_i5.p1  ORF type:complete len:498 (-),score=77.84 TRINITY_DN876_c0_g2_i5:99-1523(-)
MCIRDSINAEYMGEFQHNCEKFWLMADQSDQKELLRMKVELETGVTDELRVCEGDNYHMLAYRFCLKHSLPIQAVQALTTSIEENVAALTEREGCLRTASPLAEIINGARTYHREVNQQLLPPEEFEHQGHEMNYPAQKAEVISHTERKGKASPRSRRQVSCAGKSRFNSSRKGSASPRRNEFLHSNWHQISERKKQKAESALKEGCTFKPAFSPRSMKLAENLPPFFERMTSFIEKKNAKLEEARQSKEITSNFDLQTGRKLFVPTTGTRSPRRWNQESLPVWDHLYKQGKDSVLMRIREEERREHQIFSSRDNTSEKAGVDSNVRKKLAILFGLLDSDRDGRIYADKVDFTRVDSEICHVLTPLFRTLEAGFGDFLSEKDFVSGATLILNNLNSGMRERICARLLDESCTFRPVINKNSVQMAQNIRPYGTTMLYDFYSKERKIFEARMNERKVEKSMEQLRECSFKPEINK